VKVISLSGALLCWGNGIPLAIRIDGLQEQLTRIFLYLIARCYYDFQITFCNIFCCGIVGESKWF